MDDNKPKDSGKLKLRNTDTNRFKVDTGRLRIQPTPEVASEISKQGAGETQKSTAFVDPISLRDTSTSKLKRLDGQGAVGTTITPASAAAEKKTETVRLKVVRATPGGTLPPSAPPCQCAFSAPAETTDNPQTETSETIKPVRHQYCCQKSQEPIVGDHVSPTAVKISLKAPETPAPVPQEAPAPTAAQAAKPVESAMQGLPTETDTFQKIAPTAAAAQAAKPVESAMQGLPTETATFQKIAPSKPSTSAESTTQGLSRETMTFQKSASSKPAVEAVPSSTIKLAIKKPTGVPLPTPDSSPAATPQPEPQEATPIPPKLPSTATMD